jgi:DNA-binding HxlR family transcriptional regulator
MKRTPKNLFCPHCGKEIVNACDELILAALRKYRTMNWGQLLQETKVSKGALSSHLNGLIASGKVTPSLIERKVMYFLGEYNNGL